ncbi:MAG: dihydroorotase [Sulfurimonas sp. RIFOXYD12_FULL_33_39]|uniref:dihydroorotase n=1 Tax=unclassified Sulfurimonas TaxID=2623549 RepID=UPI0008BDA0B0|nr:MULTISPECIES: dihydroorotase [unclassified Sulfurimonas]OHE06821.1 MAG: dihydroorotase [Sulfurimonas sp. RIFCSPLOWO2_12_FULL_34_6]OHE09091.1 MAG: dihydroorotase [Sulfurimonas sp. RIFOXYD12_FULL_33_39]OHE14408.1 MAG: dihydroorotase [Sulfurimonas sp. RIFOXYD2_FULL_34_21]DAB28725.1 MAG TPA: dihydroorotase [Sulfurimonas sp. UBA10385]
MKTHTILMPLDMHLHLRDGVMLENVAPLSAYSFSGALIMPNLVPPIETLEDVKAYKARIIAAAPNDYFEPYMTLFYKNYDKKFLASVAEHITAIKLYPAGITTNSDSGISSFNIEEMRETLGAMSILGIPLCVHGETNGFVMDREAEFMSIYELLAKNFPDLKIIMEHITTKAAVDMLDKYKNLYATITVHHLLLTLDDVVGGMMMPHNFCKPIAKRPEDLDALLSVALEAHPKVMFGSDSAPHPKEKKECSGCAAGVFSAPIALQLLCEIFEQYDKLDNLQAFVSDNAQSIYKICPEFKEVILEKRPFVVPENYNGVIPMYGGKIINWAIQSVE